MLGGLRGLHIAQPGHIISRELATLHMLGRQFACSACSNSGSMGAYLVHHCRRDVGRLKRHAIGEVLRKELFCVGHAVLLDLRRWERWKVRR